MLAALLAGLVAGCAEGSPGMADPDEVRGRLDLALSDLPPCDLPPESLDDVDRLGGLRLPLGGWLTEVEQDAELLTGHGWVAATPEQVHDAFRDDLATFGGTAALRIEHEVIEAELLIKTATHRVFVLAVAVCPAVSDLVVRAVPNPAGS